MSDEINYLTPAELYAIAEAVLGRKPDVRDRRLLHSAAARPALVVFGEEVFPTVFDKAAPLLHSVAAHHVIFDGNKRTATAVPPRFLQINGLHPTRDADTIYHFVLGVAQNKWDVNDIAAWLSDHTQPL